MAKESSSKDKKDKNGIPVKQGDASPTKAPKKSAEPQPKADQDQSPAPAAKADDKPAASKTRSKRPGPGSSVKGKKTTKPAVRQESTTGQVSAPEKPSESPKTSAPSTAQPRTETADAGGAGSAQKTSEGQGQQPSAPPQEPPISAQAEQERPKKPGVSAAEEEVPPLYEEPESPIAFSPAQVEEVESISPPIPEEAPPSEATHEEPLQQAAAAGSHELPGPQYNPMFIVQITPELAPLAKVGGLADVVNGLSRELELRGNSVEIVLPKYDCMRYDHIWGLCKTFEDLWVPWYGGHIHCTVWFGFVHGRKCFFIEPHSQDNFFNRGSIYGFDDDILRFAFFSRAAIEFLWQSGKHPDIIHCHDWQTALVPVFLYEIYQHMGMTHPRVCYTIHNFKHQGVTGDFLLHATGLHRPEYYFHPDRLLDNHTPHALNLMKGGIVYSNFVTTVSPRYAGETKDGGQGFGLEPTLHAHHYKYGGIVNGIDYDTWNPEIDNHIPFNYSAETIEDKYKNKVALRHRLMLADNEKPIIAFIGRLDPQKGLDLVRHALFYALNNRAQFVLLGSSPDNEINHYFWELKRHLNDSPDCHLEIGFDEDLAHLIYAGADMIIVPSLFEPCGLTQLIAMRYGTIPIVRAVGGLADTVFDKDYAHDKPLHERNGYVFNDYDYAGIESALSRAISCYYQYPEHFRNLILNAMRYDYSWKFPGQHYLNIYEYIRDK